MDAETISKEDLIELVNSAISVLPNYPEKAIGMLHPYLPANGPVTIDYGIYSLQYALMFGEDIQATKADKDKSMPVKIGSLFEQSKKDQAEYIKLLDWLTMEMKQVHEQMSRARVNLVMDTALYESLSSLSNFNPSEVEKLVLSLPLNNPRHHLLANTYKDMYEITFFLELLANLIQMTKGARFSPDPFKTLTVNGRSVYDSRGRLIKGNAINWLEQNSDSFLVKIIKGSYNNVLRNLLGGHNDYVFDSSLGTYKSTDGSVSFEYARVLAYLSNLELLYSALRLDGLTRYYEDKNQPIKISEIGFVDWRFNKNKDEVLILQNWSNFNQRNKLKPPTMLSFYRLPIKRERKFISLGFNKNYIFPYDLRVTANNFSLELMKSLQGKNNIKIRVISVAPKVSPFTKISKTEITLAGKMFLVLGDYEAAVEIDKPALDTLIAYLEN